MIDSRFAWMFADVGRRARARLAVPVPQLQRVHLLVAGPGTRDSPPSGQCAPSSCRVSPQVLRRVRPPGRGNGEAAVGHAVEWFGEADRLARAGTAADRRMSARCRAASRGSRPLI